jgi:hypothetical protein
MKVYVKYDLEDEEDRERYQDFNNSNRNAVFYETLYDVIFRPVIKYGTEDARIFYYEEVWDAIRAMREDLEG